MSNAVETTPKPSWLRIVLGFLVLSTGLATIFTGVITAWQAWEEHLQEHWPQVTAHVDTCDLQQTSSGELLQLPELRMQPFRCRVNPMLSRHGCSCGPQSLRNRLPPPPYLSPTFQPSRNFRHRDRNIPRILIRHTPSLLQSIGRGRYQLL